MSPGRRQYLTFNWQENDRPYWLVRHDPWRYPLKVVHLPPGTDLVVAFLEEALAVHREGWRLRGLTMSFGWFIAHRNIGREVMEVALLPEDPILKLQKPRQL